MDRLRVKNEKLSELEQEQKLKNDSLQRKAMQQLQENEEEIKRLNQARDTLDAFHHRIHTCIHIHISFARKDMAYKNSS